MHLFSVTAPKSAAGGCRRTSGLWRVPGSNPGPHARTQNELLEWSGGDFDPQQFDIHEINRRLASLAPRKTSPQDHEARRR
jgi:hypothetical protein